MCWLVRRTGCVSVEIHDACRPMWQTGKPIVMRITAKDWVEGGGDFVLLARILKDRGCDYLCLTSGGV